MKIKYENNTILVKQDEFNKNIYIIMEGHITCSKNDEIIIGNEKGNIIMWNNKIIKK